MRDYITLNTFADEGILASTAGLEGFLLQTSEETWLVREDQRIRTNIQGTIAMGEEPLVLRSTGLAQLSNTGKVRRENNAFAGADDVVCVPSQGMAVVRDGHELRFCNSDTLIEVDSREIPETIQSADPSCFVGGFNAVALADDDSAYWYPVDSDLTGFDVTVDNKITDLGFLGEYFLIATDSYIYAFEPYRDSSSWIANQQWNINHPTKWLADRGREYLVTGGDTIARIQRDGSVDAQETTSILAETANHSRRIISTEGQIAMQRVKNLLSLRFNMPSEIRAHSTETFTIELENRDEITRTGTLDIKLPGGTVSDLNESPDTDPSADATLHKENYRIDSGEQVTKDLSMQVTSGKEHQIYARTEDLEIEESINPTVPGPEVSAKFITAKREPSSQYQVEFKITNDSSFPVNSPLLLRIDDEPLAQVDYIGSEENRSVIGEVPSAISDKPTLQVKDTETGEILYEEETLLDLPKTDFEVTTHVVKLKNESAVIRYELLNTGEKPIEDLYLNSSIGNKVDNSKSPKRILSGNCGLNSDVEKIEPGGKFSFTDAVRYISGKEVHWEIIAQADTGNRTKQGKLSLPLDPAIVDVDRHKDPPSVEFSITAAECEIESPFQISIPHLDHERVVDVSLSVDETHTVTVLLSNRPIQDFTVKWHLKSCESNKKSLSGYSPVSIERVITPEYLGPWETDAGRSTKHPNFCDNSSILVENILVKNHNSERVNSVTLYSAGNDNIIYQNSGGLGSDGSLLFSRVFTPLNDSVSLEEYTIETREYQDTVSACEQDIHRSEISIGGKIKVDDDDLPVLELSIENTNGHPINVLGIYLNNPPAIWNDFDDCSMVGANETTKLYEQIEPATLSDDRSPANLVDPVPMRVTLLGRQNDVPVIAETFVEPPSQEEHSPPVDIARVRGKPRAKLVLQNNFPIPVDIEKIKKLNGDHETRINESMTLIDSQSLSISAPQNKFTLSFHLQTPFGEIVTKHQIHRKRTGLTSSWASKPLAVTWPSSYTADIIPSSWRHKH